MGGGGGVARNFTLYSPIISSWRLDNLMNPGPTCIVTCMDERNLREDECAQFNAFLTINAVLCASLEYDSIGPSMTPGYCLQSASRTDERRCYNGMPVAQLFKCGSSSLPSQIDEFIEQKLVNCKHWSDP